MTITDDTAAKLREAAEKATPGPWKVCQTVVHGVPYGGHWVEPTDDDQLIQISGSGGARSYTNRVFDRQDHDDNEANAAYIAAFNPQTVLALLNELKSLRSRLFPYADATEISGISFDGKYLIGDKASITYFHEMQNRGLQIDVYKRAYDENIAAERARSTALEAERDAEKARADAAEANIGVYKETLADAFLQVRLLKDRLEEREATISTLTAERDALIRERDEARAALEKIATTSPREQGYHGPALSGYAAFEIARAVLARTGEPT